MTSLLSTFVFSLSAFVFSSLALNWILPSWYASVKYHPFTWRLDAFCIFLFLEYSLRMMPIVFITGLHESTPTEAPCVSSSRIRKPWWSHILTTYTTHTHKGGGAAISPQEMGGEKVFDVVKIFFLKKSKKRRNENGSKIEKSNCLTSTQVR